MARKIHVPDSFDTLDGGEIGFMEIHNRFADSHFGHYLADQVRYKRYKPEAVSDQQWAQAPLGADMNNLRHMPLTLGLAREFLKHQQPGQALNNSDSQVLMLASITHDWAEAITDDKMFDKKTTTEDADEATMMLFLLKKTLGNRLSSETLMQVYKTVKDRTTRLGEIFNAIERVGYLRSGLNAWDASEKEGELIRGLDPKAETELREALQWMASNVAGNQMVALLKYAEKYHPVAKYMGNVRSRVDSLFQGMPASVFAKYPTDAENEQAQQMQKFMTAGSAWQKSKFRLAIDRRDSAAG
jgi:hypothetical protein